MKKIALAALALAIGLAGATDGFANSNKARDARDRAAFTVNAGHIDSKHLVGMRVFTADGKHVGEIDHLIVGMKDGRVSHAIVGLGGVAGVGERHVVVPWSRVRIAADPKDPKDRKDMVAMIDRATLDNAQRYTCVDRIGAPAASPRLAPAGDRDRDGVRNRDDRAPYNPNKR
jgi:sporulation protein YlmC with PRC-barrel domain